MTRPISLPRPPLPRSADLFCRVVDNFGDIGIAWRLARQLVSEHDWRVRLFVDDWASFAAIAADYENNKAQYPRAFPDVYVWNGTSINDIALNEHLLASVIPDNAGIHTAYVTDAKRVMDSRVCGNDNVLSSVNVLGNADVVISAFGCALGTEILTQMAACAASQKTLWLNLEYLSAESWIESHHLLPSPHPTLQLTQYFYFPGFTAQSGGLIREHDIAPAAMSADTANNNSLSNRANRLFVFAYATAAMQALVAAIAASPDTLAVTLPAGTLSAACVAAGLPKCQVSPFVPQQQFDAVLAAHDVLIVRGEDSVIRAQYAAKPFIWHIYPQEEGAHLIKLNAFLDRYCVGLVPEAAAALRALSVTVNGAESVDLAAQWREFNMQLPALRRHAVKWQHHLLAQPDLATKLVTFVEKSLKI
jgi:uncharacterized repeat protein (TIGR03837 family)